MVAAVNEKGPGPYTPEYNVTTGEKRKLVIQSNSLPTGAFNFFFFALTFCFKTVKLTGLGFNGYKFYYSQGTFNWLSGQQGANPDR